MSKDKNNVSTSVGEVKRGIPEQRNQGSFGVLRGLIVGLIVGIAATGLIAYQFMPSAKVVSVASADFNETIDGNTVIAEFGDIKITRSMLAEQLKSADATAIQEYLQTLIYNDFFAGYTATDEEVELQFQLLKTQVGEDNWAMYLMYYANSSEDYLKDKIKENIVYEKKLQTYTDALDISDEEVKAAYDENPMNYDYCVMDVVFIESESQLATVMTMVEEEGTTITDIADALELTVSNDEYCRLSFEGIIQDMTTIQIGDWVYTSFDANNVFVGVVKELYNTYETVKEDARTSYSEEAAHNAMDEDYSVFYGEYATRELKIYGESATLSQ